MTAGIKQVKAKKTVKPKLASDFPWMVSYQGNPAVSLYKTIELAKVPVRAALMDLRSRAEIRSAENLEEIDGALSALNSASKDLAIDICIDDYYDVRFRAKLMHR